jgi:hypothetical protein
MLNLRQLFHFVHTKHNWHSFGMLIYTNSLFFLYYYMNFLRRYLPFIIIPASVAFALMFANGCASTTSPSSDGTVQMQSQLASNSAQLPYTSKNPTPKAVISSVTVTQVELFIKDIKLHQNNDSADNGDRTIKTGPMVVVYDSTGSHVFSTATVPAGTYDRVKFELHKPSANASDDGALLTQYPDFQSGNKTYTIVVKGYTTDLAGTKTNFMVRSENSHNYTIKFKDKNDVDQGNLTISGGATSLLTLQFDPRIMFHLGGGLTGVLFDPNDTTNQGMIDANSKIALRIVKN